MSAASSKKINRIVGMAVFAAIVVVLQAVATYIRIPGVSISPTLALAPIVVGAAMYGPAAGAFLGGAFGAVVLVGCATGADVGGGILWAVNPALTGALCLVKGIAAGAAAGYLYNLFSKKNVYVGVICAAVACPVVNTGIFLAAMNIFYRGTLTEWAGGAGLLYFTFIGLTGVNFLAEFGINLVLSPAVARIVSAVRRNAFAR